MTTFTQNLALLVEQLKAGITYVTTLTPAKGDNSTNLATTQYVDSNRTANSAVQFKSASVSVAVSAAWATVAAIPITFPAKSATGAFRIMFIINTNGSWANTGGVQPYWYGHQVLDGANSNNGIATSGGTSQIITPTSGSGFGYSEVMVSPYTYTPGATVTFTLQAYTNASCTIAQYNVSAIILEA
jgi:hypothetical protein